VPTIKIIIKGDVQGVFFRASAQKVATGLHITGTVKNTNEGHVEVIASGPQHQLDQLIEWCRQGPAKANVEEINVIPIGEISFDEFSIVR
jgi:acylphosphatase